MRGIQIHKNPQVMDDFDFDLVEFERNRKDYHQIKARQENDSFEVHIKRKYRGRRARLKDAVILRDSLLQNNLIQQNHK